MTLYQRKSFTLPASAGHRSTCLQYGHSFADIRGNCVRCGDPRDAMLSPEVSENTAKYPAAHDTTAPV